MPVKESLAVSNDEDFLEESLEDIIDRAYDSIDSCDYLQAFKLFSYGSTLDDRDPEILNGLGVALCELGKLDESRLVLERAFRFNPDDAITCANLAGVHWEINNYDMAAYYYKRSIDLDPMMEESYYNLANLYIETGSLYMAFILCSELKKQFPASLDATDLMDDIILNMALSMY